MELAGTQNGEPTAAGMARSVAPSTAPITGPPALTLVGPSPSLYQARVKRAIDLVVAAIVLTVLSPLMLVVWISLRIALGRDVVISQERVGRGGENFRMYKFRTMHWSRRQSDSSDRYDGPDRRVTHKADNDPRHTTIGRLLRKLSVDELPQLWNVVLGDMSLVGPRPELAVVVDSIGERDHRRHDVRPGMTGEWQVTTRQTGLPLHECFDDDLPYLERVTWRNDVRILLLTVGVVLGRGGR